MVKRSVLISTLLLLFLGRCAMTEMPMPHDNPLDRIYDSGDYRMVLTGTIVSLTESQLNWSGIFRVEKGEVDVRDVQMNGSAVIYRSAAEPSAADLDAVKKAQSLSGAFSAVGGCSVGPKDESYAGACAVTSTPKGYFILKFPYRDSSKSGTLYSNFVEIQ